MAFLLEFPVNIFFLLLGLIWQPKRPATLDENGNVLPLTSGETLKFLRTVGVRVLILGMALAGILYNLVTRFATIEAWESFAIYLGIYSLLILIVQRALPKSRPLVFMMMSVIGVMVWLNLAHSRGELVEHHWGLLLACGVNWLFWYAVGRHYPPEDKIVVYTNK